tara:strand:- start:318 stop:641 length:324 start_codon:yes stop_codon:yes gene_type:complete
MEITGKLMRKLDMESGVSKAGKEWRKQSIIVEQDTEYNKEVCISAFGEDKIKSINDLEIGETVSILCNVYSREYKGRWYNQIDGYWFARKGEEKQINNETNEDDLPF